MVQVWFPNMALTLVRRSTAALPKNSYLFRCDPKYTKSEIREYLTKVYNVNVASVNTVNYLGKARRSGLHSFKLNNFKKVYVRVNPDAPAA